PPSPARFPYTTLFRSDHQRDRRVERARFGFFGEAGEATFGLAEECVRRRLTCERVDRTVVGVHAAWHHCLQTRRRKSPWVEAILVIDEGQVRAGNKCVTTRCRWVWTPAGRRPGRC